MRGTGTLVLVVGDMAPAYLITRVVCEQPSERAERAVRDVQAAGESASEWPLRLNVFLGAIPRAIPLRSICWG